MPCKPLTLIFQQEELPQKDVEENIRKRGHVWLSGGCCTQMQSFSSRKIFLPKKHEISTNNNFLKVDVFEVEISKLFFYFYQRFYSLIEESLIATFNTLKFTEKFKLLSGHRLCKVDVVLLAGGRCIGFDPGERNPVRELVQALGVADEALCELLVVFVNNEKIRFENCVTNCVFLRWVRLAVLRLKNGDKFSNWFKGL